jgi:hypothetical protein
MSKFIKPASILFYLLSFVAFVLLGATLAAVTGAAKGHGLAGGAIVLGYGIMFGFFALIGSIIMVYRSTQKAIVIGNIVLFVLLILIASILFVRQKIRKNNADEKIKTQITTDLIHPVVYQNVKSNIHRTDEKSLGLGFFSPNYFEYPVLYFYGNPNYSKALQDHFPTDSIVFIQNEHGHFEISCAPPWLQPEYLKLDYGILYFNLQSLGKEFVEITVNTTPQNTAFVSRFEGNIILWPEFLLQVYSIEMLPENPQTLKVKPLDHAGGVNDEYEFLQPVSIKNEWIQVELQDKNLKAITTGWLRWKKDEKLLISYSMLC